MERCKCVVVNVGTNDFQYIGVAKSASTVELEGEETLFLIEKQNIVFEPEPQSGGGVLGCSVSLKFVWESVLATKCVSVAQYQVYRMLRSRGYIAWRIDNPYLQTAHWRWPASVPSPDFVVFRPNSRFAKTRCGEPDILVWVVADGKVAVQMITTIITACAQMQQQPDLVLAFWSGGAVSFVRLDGTLASKTGRIAKKQLKMKKQ